NYERTFAQHGVIHITAGAAGSNLQADQHGDCLWEGGCPPPAWSASRALHHSYVRLRFSPSEISGAAICGPAYGGEDDREDITCALDSEIDAFTIPLHRA